MLGAPYPGLHAAHGVAYDQAQVLEPQVLSDQAVLRVHHVVVVVFGEGSAQAVGRFGGFAGADRVRQDDEIFAGVQRLARAKQLACKAGVDHAHARAGGAVQHQHGFAFGVTNGGVVDAQLGHDLSGVEAEIFGDVAGLDGRGVVGGVGGEGHEGEA
jgi:hypothetical protein